MENLSRVVFSLIVTTIMIFSVGFAALNRKTEQLP